MIRYFLFTLLFLSFQNNNLSWGYSILNNPSKRNSTGRRDFLSFFTKETAAFALSVSTTTVTVTSTSAANAFENRLDDKYADVTSQQGINEPTDLGFMQRTSQTTKTSYMGLKPCSTSPNCYCSSSPFSDNMARYIPAWTGGTIQDVKRIIDTYEVGQNNIDGGGFQLIKYDEQNQYLYCQFQSYKAGYIDDFEIWFNPNKQKYDVRSSSRVGYSDLGVNAKRLEYIGYRLEKEYGWVLERRKNGSLV